MTNFNINKNNSLMALEELVKQNISKRLSYMPDSFNEQQNHALELFKQRLFLEKTIDEAISFNKDLTFEQNNKNLHLATTAEDLIDVFKLRSDVYTQINYQSQFPDTIDGLNFDKYDSHSAILFYKKDKIVTGTAKLIIDSTKYKLPSEKHFSFNTIREEYPIISELSRLIIHNNLQGLTLEFKYLFAGIYQIFINNKIDIILSCIKKEHTKLYSKFGGGKIIDGTDDFGSLGVPIHILAWNPSKTFPFFKKAFLNQKI